MFAHLAEVFPRQEDTSVDLKTTMIFPVHLTEDGFRAGGWTVTLTRDGEKNTSKIDSDWSLTAVHKELHERYRSEKLAWEVV